MALLSNKAAISGAAGVSDLSAMYMGSMRSGACANEWYINDRKASTPCGENSRRLTGCGLLLAGEAAYNTEEYSLHGARLKVGESKHTPKKKKIKSVTKARKQTKKVTQIFIYLKYSTTNLSLFRSLAPNPALDNRRCHGRHGEHRRSQQLYNTIEQSD